MDVSAATSGYWWYVLVPGVAIVLVVLSFTLMGRAVENITYGYDVHATILHLLGIDHERLTYRHDGIGRRLTDVHGRVIREILA